MSELIISCDTCLHSEINCIFSRCLSNVNSNNYFHKKYPELRKKYNHFAYFNWEPSKKYLAETKSIDMLLTDKDFEL
jgi:hypothetical protein